jgi:hypothetical protein
MATSLVASGVARLVAPPMYVELAALITAPVPALPQPASAPESSR